MDFSLITLALDSLGIPSTPRLVLLEARTLVEAHVPPFPSEFPALLTGVDSPEMALHIRNILLTVYPKEHILSLVEGEKKIDEKLADLGEGDFSSSTCVYLPALHRGDCL